MIVHSQLVRALSNFRSIRWWVVVWWSLGGSLTISIRLAPANEGTWVTYAGGAAHFQVPTDWQTYEWPFRRELRLVVSPLPPDRQAPFVSGVWMSYHHASTWRSDLERQVVRRLEGLVPNSVLRGPVEPFAGAPAGGVRQTFEAGTTGQRTQGWHALVDVESGVLEIHAEAPLEESALQAAGVQLITESLVVRPVEAELPPQLPQSLASAGPLLGSWKALQARIVFSAAGRVEAIFDGARTFRLDSRGYYDYRQRQTRLAGQFSAVDDLVEVHWDDGSRTNYRWRVGEGRLYLTDHHGRVNELARLFP